MNDNRPLRVFLIVGGSLLAVALVLLVVVLVGGVRRGDFPPAVLPIVLAALLLQLGWAGSLAFPNRRPQKAQARQPGVERST